MVPSEPLDLIPFGLLYVLTLGLLFLATEAGFQAGKAWQHRDPEKDTAIGPMVAATLGLVGFLLAFMTSYAADRFDNRRRLVLSEANVLGTAYLRAGYLPEPYAAESRQLLSEYVDVRLSAATPETLGAAIARSEEIQVELWRRAEALVEATGGSDVVALYVESVNEIVELHTQREIAALYARVPLGLILALFGFSMLGMFVLGLNNSYDRRRSLVALLSLVLVFGSVLVLIMDLDRGRDGLFQISYQPLALLQERLHP
jgi:hypothetical protein